MQCVCLKPFRQRMDHTYQFYAIRSLLKRDVCARTFLEENNNKVTEEQLIQLYKASTAAQGTVQLAQFGKSLIKQILCTGKTIGIKYFPMIGQFITPENINDEL